jgi:hypothetical protein
MDSAQHAPLSLWNVRRTLANAFKDDPSFRLPTTVEERAFRSADRALTEPTAEDAAQFHREYDAAFALAQLLSWARQQCEGKLFTSERDVLNFLCSRKVVELGRSLNLEESDRVTAAAIVTWRGLSHDPSTCLCNNDVFAQGPCRDCCIAFATKRGAA